MRTDTLFYRLFQERPALLFELAGWPWPADAGYRWQAEEVKETAFRLDGLLLPEGAGDEPLVFVEVQFQPDADFYGRWFSELCLYLYRRGWTRPWRALVLFPHRATDLGPTDAFAPFLGLPEVGRVYLDELLASRPVTGPGLGLIGLILADPRSSAAQARTLIRTAPADRDWLVNWVETILVYKLPQLSREEIQMILELQDVDLKQSRFYQEVFAEGREEGREEGRDEGRDEGREEGRQAEARGLVLRLLRRRFGAIGADAATQIDTLPLPRLETLAEDLLGFQTMADLQRWLDASPE